MWKLMSPFRRRAAAVALLAAAAAVITAAAWPPEPQSGVVAIVVHPETRIDNLTFTELQKVFRAEQQFWPDGSRITLLVRAPIAAERVLVLERIYRMTEDQFRQYWISKMFRADVASGPKIVYSSDMARELVTAIPGAITFLPADAVGAGVKVLRIDGVLPGAATYPLR
jgi:hypothetical protein